MTIEEKLKDLILNRFHSIRDFTNYIGLPYTTLDSMFRRGIDNSSITNVLKVCKALGISMDALADGEIVFLKSGQTSFSDSKTEVEDIVEDFKNILYYRSGVTVDGKPITVGGVDSLIEAMDIGVEMAKKRRNQLTESANKNENS